VITLRRPSLGASPMTRREARWGLLFLTPWVVGFLGFTLFPMVATLAFSFSNINLLQEKPLRFVGIENYQTLVGDSQVRESLLVTLKFAVLALPVGVILPLAVALLLNSKSLKGSGIFRVLFFMPYVVPFIAGVLIWQGMLSTDTGWINIFLHQIGIQDAPIWLND
jgi:ABC-type sugar transport system permease subunit